MSLRPIPRKTLIIASIALTALVAAFIVWQHRIGRGSDIVATRVDKTRYPVTGIDISAHNGIVNFEKLAADSIDFVIIKATEGATFKDRNFTDNYRRAGKAGLKVGAYHFFRFDTPGHMQALNLLHSIRGRKLDLPLAIDVEEWTNPDDEPVEAVLGRLWEMTDYLTSHGYPLMIYTNKKGLAKYFGDGTRQVPLWLCTFSEPDPSCRWAIWQHTHRGRVNGIDGHVDINTFNGTRTEFEDWIENNAIMRDVSAL